MNAVSLNKTLPVPFFPNYFLLLLICSKRENKLLDLEPAPNSLWDILTHTTAKSVTGKLTEAACRLSPKERLATASVLKPTRSRKYVTQWTHSTQESGFGLLPFRSLLLYLTSDLFVAHLTGVWARGKLCNKEPGITSLRPAQLPRWHLWNLLPRDLLRCSTCKAVEGSSIQATFWALVWFVIKQFFQNRSDEIFWCLWLLQCKKFTLWP